MDPMYLPRIQQAISRIRISEAEEFACTLLEQSRISSVAQILFSGNKTHT